MVIKEITEHLGMLERHVNECSNEVIDDVLVLGRFMEEFTKQDLHKFHIVTGKFYRECICTKKIK